QNLLGRLGQLDDNEIEKFAYQAVKEAQKGISVGDCSRCDHPLIQWNEDEAEPANQDRMKYKNKMSTADKIMETTLYFIIYPYDDRYETTSIGSHRNEGQWIKICVYCFTDLDMSEY